MSWIGPSCAVAIILLVVIIIVVVVVMINIARQATDASQKGKGESSSLHDPPSDVPQSMTKGGVLWQGQ